MNYVLTLLFQATIIIFYNGRTAIVKWSNLSLTSQEIVRSLIQPNHFDNWHYVRLNSNNTRVTIIKTLLFVNYFIHRIDCVISIKNPQVFSALRILVLGCGELKIRSKEMNYRKKGVFSLVTKLRVQVVTILWSNGTD